MTYIYICSNNNNKKLRYIFRLGKRKKKYKKYHDLLSFAKEEKRNESSFVPEIAKVRRSMELWHNISELIKSTSFILYIYYITLSVSLILFRRTVISFLSSYSTTEAHAHAHTQAQNFLFIAFIDVLGIYIIIIDTSEWISFSQFLNFCNGRRKAKIRFVPFSRKCFVLSKVIFFAKMKNFENFRSFFWLF